MTCTVSNSRHADRNGNPITTARDLIRIIDFTDNHGLRFLAHESPTSSSSSSSILLSHRSKNRQTFVVLRRLGEFELVVYH